MGDGGSTAVRRGLWIGHSITVSGKHYANAGPDELFEKVTTWKQAAQNPAQQASAPVGTDRPDESENPAKPGESGGGAEVCRKMPIDAAVKKSGRQDINRTLCRRGRQC